MKVDISIIEVDAIADRYYITVSVDITVMSIQYNYTTTIRYLIR